MGEAAVKQTPLARRVARLDVINNLLIGLKRDYGACLITQIQEKARVYEANMHVSHGERQGIANAQTAQIATEVQQLKSQIDVLEEERDHLRFLTQWVED